MRKYRFYWHSTTSRTHCGDPGQSISASLLVKNTNSGWSTPQQGVPASAIEAEISRAVLCAGIAAQSAPGRPKDQLHQSNDVRPGGILPPILYLSPFPEKSLSLPDVICRKNRFFSHPGL